MERHMGEGEEREKGEEREEGEEKEEREARAGRAPVQVAAASCTGLGPSTPEGVGAQGTDGTRGRAQLVICSLVGPISARPSARCSANPAMEREMALIEELEAIAAQVAAGAEAGEEAGEDAVAEEGTDFVLDATGIPGPKTPRGGGGGRGRRLRRARRPPRVAGRAAGTSPSRPRRPAQGVAKAGSAKRGFASASAARPPIGKMASAAVLPIGKRPAPLVLVPPKAALAKLQLPPLLMPPPLSPVVRASTSPPTAPSFRRPHLLRRAPIRPPRRRDPPS